MAWKIDVTDHAQLRRDLRDYVTSWINGGRINDPKMLARHVVDAPAFETLSATEWWNVAILLAQELTHRGL